MFPSFLLILFKIYIKNAEPEKAKEKTELKTEEEKPLE